MHALDASNPLPVALPDAGVTYRAYRGLEDVAGMAAANGRLRRYAGQLDPVNEESMRHRYQHLVNSDPLVDCVIAEVGGETAGYVRVEWHDLVDGDRLYDVTVVVEPDAWGRGIARDLVRWGERRCRTHGAALAQDRRSWFGNYAFAGDAELDSALDEAGYERVRLDAEMLRPDLENLPAVVPPDGYVIRPPEEDELMAVHLMSVDAFAEHWGEWEASEQSFEEWVEDPRFRRDLVIVAWAADGSPASYVANVLDEAEDGTRRGLLDGVATHPAHRRRGLARATIAESLRLLRDAGATSAYLGVDTDNHNRALALYESCGFRTVSTGFSYRKPFTLEPTR